MRRKLKHSFLGMSLVAATVAAPIGTTTAGAQGGWNGFETISVPTDLGNEGDLNNSAGWGAGITNDLGGTGVDLWVNNHANRSEALIDFVGGTPVFNDNVAAEAGLKDTHGVTFSDIDGDGDEDLIETVGGGDGANSANRVRINNNGTLAAPNDTSGLSDQDGRGRQTLMVDIDNDGDMDAIVANLLNTGTAAPSELYLNNGSGVFTKVTDTNNVLSDDNIRFAHVTTTGPGEDNVIVTSNGFSFAIDTIRTGESTLVAEANPVTQTVGADDNATNLRDIALGDLDGDLEPEWVAARQDDFLAIDDVGMATGNPDDPMTAEDESQEGDGTPDFLGELAIGIGQVSVNGNDIIDDLVDVSSDLLADNCRAISLADFDNDADLDIFGGCTMAENGQDRNIVLLNDGAGNFTIASSALVPATADNTAVVVVNADFNNDGWVDTYVGGGHDNAAAVPPITGLAEDHIFLNEGGTNNYLKIDLEATNNPDAVGTQVFVGTDKWQVRESGHRVHRGQDMRELHFGLGSQSAIAPLEIMWPDGTFERCQADGINQTVTITQGGDNCVEQTKSGLVAAVGTTPNLDPLVAPLMCNDLLVTVNLADGDVPTAGDDVIRGTAGNDVINALGGNDTICALQGDDVIDGGDGFDKVFAGAGDDTINGGVGNDTLVGGDGNDTINGGTGNDRLQGGGGVDELNGDGGLDRLAGNNGNDILRGGTHDDQLFGNLGRDQLFGDGGNDVLRGGAWVDIMNGGAGTNDGCTLTDPGGLTETRVDCEGGVFGR